VRDSIKNRAGAIREYVDKQDDVHADAATIYRYSVAAAQWEAMRLLIDSGKGTVTDDRRFSDLSDVLLKLTRQIGLGHSIVGWNGFLPRDPGRIINTSWLESARLWFD
jgi:hypothetical protein